MDRAVAVVRVSSNGQREAAQVPIVNGWSADHGYEVIDTIEIHAKSAKTGAHLGDLEKAVRMVEADIADVIVMVRLDRMSRQGLDAALHLRRRVREAGGRWEFARQQRLNGNGIDADREWARRAIDAQEESELRMERIAEGYAEAISNGAATIGPRYGWAITGDTQDKRWVTDNRRSEVVSGIYSRVADGTPLRACRQWAHEQDPSVAFHLEHIRHMIDDRTYDTGVCETTVNGEPYSFEVPALIDPELAARARASIGTPKRYKHPAKCRWTGGIVQCGLCSSAMKRTSENRYGARYWACTECKARVRDDVTQVIAHDTISTSKGELFNDVLVKPSDTREARKVALERERDGLSRKYGSDIDGMIARATAIKSELAEIDAEVAPRGHVESTPAGKKLGELYGELDSEEEINAALKRYNVRVIVWRGDPNPLTGVLAAMNVNRRSEVMRRDGITAVVHWGLL